MLRYFSHSVCYYTLGHNYVYHANNYVKLGSKNIQYFCSRVYSIVTTCIKLCSLYVIIIVVVTHMYVVSLGELQQNSGNSSFLVPLPPQSCIRHLQRVDRNQQMLHEVS